MIFFAPKSDLLKVLQWSHLIFPLIAKHLRAACTIFSLFLTLCPSLTVSPGRFYRWSNLPGDCTAVSGALCVLITIYSSGVFSLSLCSRAVVPDRCFTASITALMQKRTTPSLFAVRKIYCCLSAMLSTSEVKTNSTVQYISQKSGPLGHRRI